MSNVKKRSRVVEKRWVRKNDGRLETFKKSKLRVSVLKAGASRKQARQVANTITNSVRVCELCEDIEGKKQVSSARLSNVVIAELQKINKDAAERFTNYRREKQKTRNPQAPFGTSPLLRENRMETKESQRLMYTNKVNALVSEISSISQQANTINNSIESLNDRVHTLPTRITRVRQGNYRALTHLEAEQVSLSEMWTTLNPNLRAITSQRGEAIHLKTQDLQRVLTQKQRRADYNLGNLQDIESGLSELRRDISVIQSQVASSLTPIEKQYQNIDKDLRMAESTVTLVSDASFPWIEGETPVIATKAKDLNNDIEGIITLTNLRFIFEQEKEIVLKKRFFIVTEKKIVREVAIHKPIGMVTQLVKGKVGFFKGAGLFVEFASESGIPDMKFDTQGHEADWLTQGYNYIVTGQVDEELATASPESTPDQETPQLVACQICGAPYNEMIYRGQTSVNCRYCGAVVAL
jgi:hypothetical protein